MPRFRGEGESSTSQEPQTRENPARRWKKSASSGQPPEMGTRTTIGMGSWPTIGPPFPSAPNRFERDERDRGSRAVHVGSDGGVGRRRFGEREPVRLGRVGIWAGGGQMVGGGQTANWWARIRPRDGLPGAVVRSLGSGPAKDWEQVGGVERRVESGAGVEAT